ncbi:MAG: PqqD family protein [Pyrinomonadaceae bacterium MAG19_C2-C3]|nr:PqqD family protein [Pyrinomonadaceae bacterium MAG19_C2-C3]
MKQVSTHQPERDAYPHARTEELIVRQIATDTLVYDKTQHKALCLNETAAFLWQNCDGKTPASILADKLGTHFNTPASEEVVHLGLSQLSKQGLLRERLQMPRAAIMSRRAVLRRAGVAAAISLPLVTAIVAPRAVQAATLGGSGARCMNGSECATGICNGGVCA